ncbi:flagellar biosynthetic protein FliO [Butyrivibrio sp. M55]|uniref:flagellar biosynthetic protein FliO n=1 Tax=Butyrivibrio sp. M55 TaxID=1855323 RepID=UPI0008E86B5B|nr:flagellar biosynthetic protein FliO [Butyrivibrio sp. M55]SFU33799.1 flagellar protein FliO/FliZ [Butyrivibrio sp. M55]
MSAESYLQFVAILIIFVLVLGLTYYVTKWLAGYQKEKGSGKNIEVLETGRISTTKYIQIVRLGNKYMAIAVGKDEVTALCELDKESLVFDNPENASTLSFNEILEKIKSEFKK